MDIGTSPYNFVPLNEHIYFPEWAKDISMDIPFEDGEDGIIEVEWINDSPLFTRDVQNANHKDAPENQYSMHIPGAKDGTRRYFLPGSSLRGMLRNVLSILSFGKMNQYNNVLFGYRDIPNKDYRNKMDKIRYGWLEKTGDNYRLYTREESFWNKHNLKNLSRRIDGLKGKEKREIEQNALAINIDDVDKRFSGYKEQKDPSAWKQNDFLRNKDQDQPLFPYYKAEGEEFNIFATGYIQGKKHEILIPSLRRKDDDIIKLKPTIVDKFKKVYAPTPDFDQFLEYLENEPIPVSYIPKGHDDVEVLGMGRMIRYPYKHDIKDLVKQERYDDNQLDLCETIFGWVGKEGENNCMKGRVQVGNAFAEKDIADSELREVTGVLGAPKASFWPFYIKQNGKEFLTYDNDNATISGRKWYRIHKGGSTMPLPNNEENENVEIKFKPIPAGQRFKMRINVHNLKKVEVGALLSAITLHKQSKVWHSIGLAKSFGFGKLHCESLTLRGLNYKEHDYIVAFERKMEQFTQHEYKAGWLERKQTTTLFSIMSEHEGNEVKMMELEKEIGHKKTNEYEETKKKKKNNPSYIPLTEKQHCIKPVSTEEEREEFKLIMLKEKELVEIKKRDEELKKAKEEFERLHENEYNEIKQLVAKGDTSSLNIAISKQKTLIAKLGKNKPTLCTTEEESWLKEIENKYDDAKKAEDDAKVKLSLADVLEEKYPNKDEYKVKDLRALVQKCKNWMKTHEMDGTAKATFIRSLKRVKAYDEKKYGKQWKQNEKFVSEILSQEEIDSIRP